MEKYGVPDQPRTNGYVKCKPEELIKLGKDPEVQRKLWDFSEEAIRRPQM